MGLIPLQELADDLNYHKSSLRKHCLKRGYEIHHLVTPTSKGQAVMHVSTDDAELVRLFAHDKGRPIKE